MGALRGMFLTAHEKVCRRGQFSTSVPNHAISASRLTVLCAFSALAGATTPLETASIGNGSMPYFPGLIAAAVRTAAGFAIVPTSVIPVVRSSAAHAQPACRSQRERSRALPLPPRPAIPHKPCASVAHDLPAASRVPCACAAAAASPPPRVHEGRLRAPVGCPEAATAATGRCTRVPAAAEGAAVHSSVGGVRGVHGAAAVASAAVVDRHRARRDRASRDPMGGGCEIGTVCRLERPRHCSGWAGGGHAVPHGHTGGGPSGVGIRTRGDHWSVPNRVPAMW